MSPNIGSKVEERAVRQGFTRNAPRQRNDTTSKAALAKEYKRCYSTRTIGRLLILSMDTALIIGHGLEAAALLARRHLLSPNLVPFTTSLSFSPPGTTDFPVLDLDDPYSARRDLKSRNVTGVVMIGSFRIDNPELETAAVIRMANRIGPATSISDAIKRTIHTELGPGFEFPAAKSVLPFLFVEDNVGVNCKPDLLARALVAAGSSGCVTVDVDGEAAKVFKIPGSGEANLFNCCLAPEKLCGLHQNHAVKRFFFDRNRTIILDYDYMRTYALHNELTLQSFVEPSP